MNDIFTSENMTANNAKIQCVVDNTSAGDTIILRDGAYIENVDMNKDHLTIQTSEKFDQNASQSESGAEATIVQAANPDDHVFI